MLGKSFIRKTRDKKKTIQGPYVLAETGGEAGPLLVVVKPAGKIIASSKKEGGACRRAVSQSISERQENR